VQAVLLQRLGYDACSGRTPHCRARSTGLATPATVYLAAVSSRTYRPVTKVAGLGLTWTKLADQCTGRGTTTLAATGSFASALDWAWVAVRLRPAG